MKAKLIVTNVGWPSEKMDDFMRIVVPFAKKMSEELLLANNILVRLELENSVRPTARGLYDEGVIIIYLKSPDWLGDFSHELAHSLVRFDKLSYVAKAKINKLYEYLQAQEGDGRVFMNPHTYSNPKEVFCTLFRWYMLGRFVHVGYIEVLENFVPWAMETIKFVLYGREHLMKSGIPKKLVFKKPIRVIDNTPEIKEEDIKAGTTTFSGFKVKKRIEFQGLKISIENPAGSIRRGIDDKGNPWKTNIKDHYGYILNTCSNEPRDQLDCFVSEISPRSTIAFIVKQQDPETQIYDEDKVILGVDTLKQALKVYQRNYDNSWKKRIKEVKETSVENLKKMVIKTQRIDL